MILQYLKEHTTQIHQEIERENLAKYIIDHTISKENYQKLLIQNFNFYHILEETLIQNAHLVDDTIKPFLTNTKSQSLKKDLLGFGLDIEQAKFSDLSFTAESEEAVLGALYVIEGSALGGMVIGRHLKKCTALESVEKHHFFEKDTPSLLKRWNSFRQAMGGLEELSVNKEQVLTSAIASFELFGSVKQHHISL